MITTLKTRLRRTNRKPIGILHVSEISYRSPINPAGWQFNVMAPSFEAGIDAYIDRAIPVCQECGVQAVIAWDLEGKEFYDKLWVKDAQQFQVGYLGSPDLVSKLNPSWARRIPYFFKRFNDVGIEGGCCLRPWEYDLVSGSWSEPEDYFLTLLRKAIYAHKNWGCRFFYIDTNVFFHGPERVIPALVLRRLRAALPDCIFVCEVESDDYWGDLPCYMELRGGETGPPARVLEAMPDAWGVNNLSAGDVEGNLAALLARRGIDIWMMCTWWKNKETERFARLVAGA